jgi:hypothetical protein
VNIMDRMLTVLLCAGFVGWALQPSASFAKDSLLSLELDGRPLDANSPSGMLHRGKAFVNVVRIVKGFSGLLTFGKNDKTVRVTIATHTADFTVGRSDGAVNGERTTFSAPPFILNGDTYVPLDVVAHIAGATLAVDTRRHIARLTSAPPSPSP